VLSSESELQCVLACRPAARSGRECMNATLSLYRRRAISGVESVSHATLATVINIDRIPSVGRPLDGSLELSFSWLNSETFWIILMTQPKTPRQQTQPESESHAELRTRRILV
jgi:hypothetical protein